MNKTAGTIARRELLVRTAPACALTCLGLGRAEGLAAAFSMPPCQEVHKFDRKEERSYSSKELAQMMARTALDVIRTLRRELGDPETIRLLKLTSEEMGRQRAPSTPRDPRTPPSRASCRCSGRRPPAPH